MGSIGGISWGYLGRTQVRCQLVTLALFCLTSFFLFILDAIGRFRRPALWYYACAAVFDHWKFWPSCSCLRRALRAISDHVQDYAAQIYLRTTEIMQNFRKTVDFEKGITKKRPIVLENRITKAKIRPLVCKRRSAHGWMPLLPVVVGAVVTVGVGVGGRRSKWYISWRDGITILTISVRSGVGGRWSKQYSVSSGVGGRWSN